MKPEFIFFSVGLLLVLAGIIFIFSAIATLKLGGGAWMNLFKICLFVGIIIVTVLVFAYLDLKYK